MTICYKKFPQHELFFRLNPNLNVEYYNAKSAKRKKENYNVK